MEVALTPDGKTAYVLNQHSNTLSLIDTASGSVQKTLDAGSAPRSIALSTDGKMVFVTNFGEENLSVIDTAEQRVVQHYRIPLM